MDVRKPVESQKKVERAPKCNYYDLPATVLVIEAWSDEQAFYIFNGAQYNVKEDGEPFHLSDLGSTNLGLIQKV